MSYKLEKGVQVESVMAPVMTFKKLTMVTCTLFLHVTFDEDPLYES